MTDHKPNHHPPGQAAPRYFDLRKLGNLLKSDRWITGPVPVAIIVTAFVVWLIFTFVSVPAEVVLP